MPSKKAILLTLAAVYGVAGVFVGLAVTTDKAARGFDFLLGVATMVCVYLWCRADAQSFARLVGRWPLWVAIFPPIVLPLYFFRTRTRHRALTSTAKAVAYYVGICALMLVLAVLLSSFRAA